MTELLLVSGSPRRRELLEMMTVPFQVFNADIDETLQPAEAPPDYVQRLARSKARAGMALKGSGRPALGADTIVLLQGEILGKPEDRPHARRMLSRLSGATHEVLTAVCVVRPDGEERTVLNCSRVTMGLIPDAWLDSYVQLAEPMDKAGAYAIQGLSGQWVEHLEGSYTGVMGLPLFETAALLRWAGVQASQPPLTSEP